MEISTRDVCWGTISRSRPMCEGTEGNSIGYMEDAGPTEASATPMGNYATRTTFLSCPELEGGGLAFTVPTWTRCWIWLPREGVMLMNKDNVRQGGQ